MTNLALGSILRGRRTCGFVGSNTIFKQKFSEIRLTLNVVEYRKKGAVLLVPLCVEYLQAM